MGKHTPEEIQALNDNDLNAYLAEVERRAAGGDTVFNPGRSVGVTSATTKSFGRNALETIAEGKGNGAQWMAWKDPSESMDPDHRADMLQKSWKEAGYEGKIEWNGLGEFLQDGWMQKCRGMQSDFARKHAATYEGLNPSFVKARGMNTLSGENGGFLINPELAPTIDTLFDTSDLPGRVDTVSTGATWYKFPRLKDLNRNDGTRHGGVMHKWIDESDPGDESRPKVAFTELRMKKLAVFVFMTTEIMSDTPYAVEQVVRNAVREEINFALARAIMWGKGGVEPIGFAQSGSCITVAKESGQAADTFVTANAMKMTSRLWKNSRSQAIWMHHQSMIPQIGTLSLNNFPVSINIQTGGVTNPVTSTLLGKPMIESELCAPIGELGDIFYLDPKMYKAISASGVREDVSMHVEFMTDQQCLRFIMRFDGAPLYDTPITPYKSPDSTVDPETQSSFVKLAARA
ncbi:MAG: phage major capsid protein [Desulfurellales bacterium]|nr:MAG: phage major capsid protein [Desulfurellales bacterium]